MVKRLAGIVVTFLLMTVLCAMLAAGVWDGFRFVAYGTAGASVVFAVVLVLAVLYRGAQAVHKRHRLAIDYARRES